MGTADALKWLLAIEAIGLVALPLGGARASVARLKEVVKRAVGADVFGAAPDAES